MDLIIDWDFHGYFESIINKNSPYGLNSSPLHPLWKHFTYPEPESLLEQNKMIINNALKAEERLLLAMGYKPEGAMIIIEDPDDDDSFTHSVQCIYEMIEAHKGWLDEVVNDTDTDDDELCQSDLLLRDYVLYMNWLFAWVSSMYSTGMLSEYKLENEDEDQD